MRHHVDRPGAAPRDVAQQLEAVRADRVVDRDVLGGRSRRLPPTRRRRARDGASGSDARADAVERPAQVDGGRSRRVERRVRARERGIAGVAVEREREAIGADGADQRRAADQHPADRERGGVGVGDVHLDARVRQRALVERLDEARRAAAGRARWYGAGSAIGDGRAFIDRCRSRCGTWRDGPILAADRAASRPSRFSTWKRLLKSSVHSRQSGRAHDRRRRLGDLRTRRAAAGSSTASTQSLRLASRRRRRRAIHTACMPCASASASTTGTRSRKRLVTWNAMMPPGFMCFA